MALVDVCPKTSTTVIEASKRLGCGHDEFGNSQYLCLPNINMTSFFEFCYEGIMGLQEKGLVFFYDYRKLFDYLLLKFMNLGQGFYCFKLYTDVWKNVECSIYEYLTFNRDI